MGSTVFNSMPRCGMLAAVRSVIEWGGRVIVAENMAGGVLYAAVRMPGGKVRGVVALIEGLSYKLMAEEEGPYYYEASAEVLEQLSPTDDPWCLKWRMKCADPALNPGAA